MMRYRLTYGLLYYKKMNHRATTKNLFLLMCVFGCRLTYGLLYYKKMNHRATYIHMINLWFLICVWRTCPFLVVKRKWHAGTYDTLKNKNSLKHFPRRILCFWACQRVINLFGIKTQNFKIFYNLYINNLYISYILLFILSLIFLINLSFKVFSFLRKRCRPSPAVPA